ncbi:MAG: hypothetical protein JO159_00335 [Acidobacteria bacterium]|nr:hypothetical protein [Acidobacteriota bacterium]MBV9622911.1 hypothetical protein [Acidobacteriota bacterium]
MADEVEQVKSEDFDLRHYVGIVRRRHLFFLVPLLVGWLIVWGLSWVLPPRYRSSTLILVEQPTMPKDYVMPNVNDDLQERLQSITQQILSRTRLLRVIEQLHLYGEAGEKSPDAKVETMRKQIEIELVRDGSNHISAFNLSYSSRDPKIAQQVTNALTNMFINENLEVRQKQSEGTTTFLEKQLDAARVTLAEQEQKVRLFKAQHVGEMPGQLATNLQILSGLQAQLQNEEDSLNGAKQQHVYLQSLADQYRAMQGRTNPDGTMAAGLPAIDKELDKLQAQLADLNTRYTDGHPDVIKLKEKIARTEKMRDDVLASMKSKGQSAKAASDSAPAEGADPSQTSLLVQVQSQLRANQIETANREHSIAALKAKIEDYQARLNQEPVREQQLADLTRGYDQSKASYDDLLKKKNESAMATSMELLQQGERFRILDPPSFPQRPVYPNRLKFCGMGLGVGLALGVLVAAAFEVLDDRLHDEKELKNELKKLLPVEVVAEIPAIVNDSDVENARRRNWLGWATAGVVFSTILIGSAVSYFYR